MPELQIVSKEKERKGKRMYTLFAGRNKWPIANLMLLSFIADDFHESALRTKYDSQNPLLAVFLRLLESIKDVGAISETYSTLFTTYPVTIQILLKKAHRIAI